MKIQRSSLRRALALVLTGLLLVFLCVYFLVTRPNLPWTKAQQIVDVFNVATSDDRLPKRLESHVRKIVTEFLPRDSGHAANLAAASAYIRAELSSLASDVSFQSFRADGEQYRNVVAKFGPDTADVIVIGAHYDSFDELPAADDNASGVAGLIEVARLLSNIQMKKRVELVAYTLEEPPYFRTEHMGSAVHARALKAAGKSVSLMLSLECIGYFSDAPNSQAFPVSVLGALYPTTGDFIALVGHYRDGALAQRVRETMRRATVLPVHSINAPSFVAGIDFSDHLNYWNEGFVGMMVTDTAFMRNKNYHTEDDTPEKLDYRRMADVVRGVTAAVLAEATR